MSHESGSFSYDWRTSSLGLRFPIFPIIEDDGSSIEGNDEGEFGKEGLTYEIH